MSVTEGFGEGKLERSGFPAARLGLPSAFPLAPLDEEVGVGSEKVVICASSGYIFFTLPVLGIPENSFQPNPQWALSGF